MEDSEKSKPEQATPFKLMRARKRGVVARGTDLGFFAALAACFGYLWVSGPSLAARIAETARETLVLSPRLIAEPDAVLAVTGRIFTSVLRPLGILFGTVFFLVLIFELLQTGVVFSAIPLKPDFSRINPAAGLKRMFSIRLLIETAKALVKCAIYSTVAYLVIHKAYTAALQHVRSGESLMSSMAAGGFRLVFLFLLCGVVIVALDQILARGQFRKQMRMSRREIRQEIKEREGEPRMKQRRKKLHAEFANTRQSLRSLKSADIVIVNPVHYAVALKYVPEAMNAPKVVSMGADALALRLKRMAFLYGVVIVEDRVLARDLYRVCVLDREIPSLLYGKVADAYLLHVSKFKTLENRVGGNVEKDVREEPRSYPGHGSDIDTPDPVFPDPNLPA